MNYCREMAGVRFCDTEEEGGGEGMACWTRCLQSIRPHRAFSPPRFFPPTRAKCVSPYRRGALSAGEEGEGVWKKKRETPCILCNDIYISRRKRPFVALGDRFERGWNASTASIVEFSAFDVSDFGETRDS